MADNGNGKWSIAFWVVTVMTVASFGWTTFCFFHNQNKINDLAQTANHSLTSISANMNDINIRLSRIEWKLEQR